MATGAPPATGSLRCRTHRYRDVADGHRPRLRTLSENGSAAASDGRAQAVPGSSRDAAGDFT